MNKSKVNLKNRSFIFSSCIGAGAAAVLSLLLIMTLSICILNEYIELNAAGYIALLGQFVSVFVGVLLSDKIGRGERRSLTCCCTAMMYYLTFLCLGMLLFNGNVLSAIWSALICIIGSGLAILLATKGKRSISKKRRKRGSR